MQALSFPLLGCQESNVNKRRREILDERFILRSHISFSFPDEKKNSGFITPIFFSLLFVSFLSNRQEIFAGIVVMRVNMRKEKRIKGWQGNSSKKKVVMKSMTWQRNSRAWSSTSVKHQNEVSTKFCLNFFPPFLVFFFLPLEGIIEDYL